jgi:hypothetical protein
VASQRTQIFLRKTCQSIARSSLLLSEEYPFYEFLAIHIDLLVYCDIGLTGILIQKGTLICAWIKASALFFQFFKLNLLDLD